MSVTGWKILPILNRHSRNPWYRLIRKVSHVCVVGAGPAGFYAAQQLIKVLPEAQVDIYERLPVPFGLVRFGVAPDHPEVKNVINTFTKTAHNPKVRFVGNVSVGQDVSLEQLRTAYHAVLLTYGADEDRELGIPGESLRNVVSARRFVGWYNGVPWDRDLAPDLDVDTVAVLGQGNVALDVARILLTPLSVLKSTDITAHALASLERSRVQRVLLLGRRGPLQAAFTIKELREMTTLPDCRIECRADDFAGVREVIAGLPRPRRRLTELLCKVALDTPPDANASKAFCPLFLRNPARFVPAVDRPEAVGGIELDVTRLEGDSPGEQRAVPAGDTETVTCSLALRSIGYRSRQADAAIPFDSAKGVVSNKDGVVEPGLYCAGWVASGPVGVIVNTMTNAFTVARNIADHMSQGTVDVSVKKPGYELISSLLEKKGIQTVSFRDWECIDAVEQERGKKVGKPREKIVDVSEMLRVAATGR